MNLSVQTFSVGRMAAPLPSLSEMKSAPYPLVASSSSASRDSNQDRTNGFVYASQSANDMALQWLASSAQIVQRVRRQVRPAPASVSRFYSPAAEASHFVNLYY